ncbi:hypothetical protein OTU49_010891, partial [Cherax quadricarinatus]
MASEVVDETVMFTIPSSYHWDSGNEDDCSEEVALCVAPCYGSDSDDDVDNDDDDDDDLNSTNLEGHDSGIAGCRPREGHDLKNPSLLRQVIRSDSDDEDEDASDYDDDSDCSSTVEDSEVKVKRTREGEIAATATRPLIRWSSYIDGEESEQEEEEQNQHLA